MAISELCTCVQNVLDLFSGIFVTRNITDDMKWQFDFTTVAYDNNDRPRFRMRRASEQAPSVR